MGQGGKTPSNYLHHVIEPYDDLSVTGRVEFQGKKQLQAVEIGENDPQDASVEGDDFFVFSIPRRCSG